MRLLGLCFDGGLVESIAEEKGDSDLSEVDRETIA